MRARSESIYVVEITVAPLRSPIILPLTLAYDLGQQFTYSRNWT